MENHGRTQPSYRSMDIVPPKNQPGNGAPPPQRPVQAAPVPLEKEPVEPQLQQVPIVNPSPSSPPASMNELRPAASAQPPKVRSHDPDTELDNIIGEVDAHHKQQPAAASPSGRQRPILIAVIALVVAVALAVVAVFAFRNTEKVDTPPAVTNLNSNPAAKRTVPVTTNELTTYSQSVDKDFNALDDAKDFSGTDTTDQALGL